MPTRIQTGGPFLPCLVSSKSLERRLLLPPLFSCSSLAPPSAFFLYIPLEEPAPTPKAAFPRLRMLIHRRIGRIHTARCFGSPFLDTPGFLQG